MPKSYKYFGHEWGYRKLKYMPNSSAKVIWDSCGVKMLWSRNNLVAHIDKDGYLSIFPFFDAITRRHISAFVHEYALSALRGYSVEQWGFLANGGSINVETGEVSTVGYWRDRR